MDVEGEIRYVNSKPCSDCVNIMLRYGIKWVVYSTGNDEQKFRKVKVSDLAQEEKYIVQSKRIKNHY